jgi:hypothetical protein
VLHGDLVTAFVRLFPFWVTLGGVVALIYPPAFTWFLDYGLITPGLQIIMLGMGLTLELSDFSSSSRAHSLGGALAVHGDAASRMGRGLFVSTADAVCRGPSVGLLLSRWHGF